MFVAKLVICVGIVGICTYIGMFLSKRLSSREYILREMITFLQMVENEMKYMLAILPNAYESARQKLNTELKSSIGQIVIDMLKGEDIDQIDKSIVRNINSLDELSAYDKSIFISTLRNLGRSDVESQINIINNSVNILNNQVKEANEVKLKNSKIYRTLGIISGLMLVIVFI